MNTTTTTPLRVALVGCGTVSVNHLHALAADPRVRIVALCDVRVERAETRRREYAPQAAVYTNYDEMLRTVPLDAIHITTPHYLHVPMAVQALARDIHVFLEKPLGISTQQIDELLAAEARSRAHVTVCFQNRFNHSTELARKIVREDGGVRNACASVFWYRDVPYYTESGWRGALATEGGGVMINQAIHTIDLLCQFLGRPETVTATTANHHLKGVIEVEDSCEGVICFTGGGQASFYATTAAIGCDDTRVLLVTAHHRIEVCGEYLTVDGIPQSTEIEADDIVGKPCYGTGHRRLIHRFYTYLLNGGENPVTVESSQYALRILLAAYRSHDTEQPV